MGERRQRLTIFVRHQLEPASQRLMETLGVAVVVDPDAPACVIGTAGGKRRTACPRCLAIDARRAQAVARTADVLLERARAAARTR